MDEPAETPVDRVRLEALRYAVADEAISYIAIMRLFAGGVSGLLSDQSATEVAERLEAIGLHLDVGTVDARLSYLVEHGNLARSPRETEARTLQEYLASRARYQLTQRGALVHQHVEDLLGHTDAAREVSSEMLAGIHESLQALLALPAERLGEVEPDEIALHIGRVFAQFERLVDSTKAFYTYLSRVLTRYDLGRDEYLGFKTALLDYLQRFVDEVARHMPQVADALTRVAPMVEPLCARAASGPRLVGVDGTAARRSRGLDPADWPALTAWFVGGAGRDADADGVRRLATEAMRSLLGNLRRIVADVERERSRYADLIMLARWLDEADDDTAHALWTAAFGLYSCRHLARLGADDADPVSPSTSWWDAPPADVPVMLRTQGERKMAGRVARRADYAAAKHRRVAEREAAERGRLAALAEVADLADAPATGSGAWRLSDGGRTALLELYARALSGHGGPVRPGRPARSTAALADGNVLEVVVSAAPGRELLIRSPGGDLRLVDLRLEVRRRETRRRLASVPLEAAR